MIKVGLFYDCVKFGSLSLYYFFDYKFCILFGLTIPRLRGTRTDHPSVADACGMGLAEMSCTGV